MNAKFHGIAPRVMVIAVSGVAALASMAALGQERPSIADLQAQIAALQANEVAGLASYLSVDTTDPARPALRVSGANVQIVNGLAASETNNGVGNLIVGYDEPRQGGLICSNGNYSTQMTCQANGGTWAVSHKSGSHNVVIGPRHAYSRYAGVVAGAGNAITGVGSTVTAGSFNVASGAYSHIGGGRNHTASGQYSSITGGQQNIASNTYATVSGGRSSLASGNSATVSGGANRLAAGADDWAAGSLFQEN